MGAANNGNARDNGKPRDVGTARGNGKPRDVVIVGAGHNGLVAAAYLARAGLDVEVVERRPLVGGACVTEEVFPGYRASTCSYVIGLLRPEIIRDLELKRFGLELYQSDVLNANILPGGRRLFLWQEFDRTLREIDRVAPGDAEAYLRFGARVNRFAELINPFVMSPAPTLSEVVAAFEEAGEKDLFTEFFTLSLTELLDRYGFKSPILRGFLSFLSVVSVYGSPSTPGSAYVYGHHSWGEFEGKAGQYGFARGGMSGLSEAIAAAARHHGATIRTGKPVDHVLIENGVARGIVLEDGEEIRARAVVCNADPVRTYLSLVGAEHLPGEFVERVKAIDMRGSEAHLLVALDGLPSFEGLAETGPEYRGLTLLNATEGVYEKAFEAQRRGVLPDEISVEFAVDSARDDTLTPPGKHLMNIGLQQVPPTPAEGTWDDLKPEFTRRILETMESFAPGFHDRVIDVKAITPLDLERDYGLTGGNIFHGAMTLGQLFDSRPVSSVSSYRSPLEGLYLCGAGTHPGGGVMGANGHNAAHTVLADLSGAEQYEAWAAGAGRRRRVGAARGRGLLVLSLESPRISRLALKVAKQPWSRPLARLATRRKRG